MSSAIAGLGAIRIGVGAAWLGGLAAGWAACGARLPRTARTAATALALRDLAQGSLLAARPRRTSVEVGTVVDAVHAVSMAAVFAGLPRYRGPAAVSAAVALAWVAAARAVLRASR